jgi:uncharacterized membrane protein
MLLATIGTDTYEWFLAIHILAAVIWVGSDVAIQIFTIRAKRAGESSYLAHLATEIEWYGTRVLLPSSLTIVVFGFLLINQSDGAYGLGDFFVGFAFAVWIFSFLIGLLFLGPQSGKLGEELEARGPEDPGYQSRLARVFLISRIELVLLILVVLDMTIKPFF